VGVEAGGTGPDSAGTRPASGRLAGDLPGTRTVVLQGAMATSRAPTRFPPDSTTRPSGPSTPRCVKPAAEYVSVSDAGPSTRSAPSPASRASSLRWSRRTRWPGPPPGVGDGARQPHSREPLRPCDKDVQTVTANWASRRSRPHVANRRRIRPDARGAPRWPRHVRHRRRSVARAVSGHPARPRPRRRRRDRGGRAVLGSAGGRTVIQRACERALAAGATLDRILAMLHAVRPSVRAPIVLFSYANPIFRMASTRSRPVRRRPASTASSRWTSPSRRPGPSEARCWIRVWIPSTC